MIDAHNSSCASDNCDFATLRLCVSPSLLNDLALRLCCGRRGRATGAGKQSDYIGREPRRTALYTLPVHSRCFARSLAPIPSAVNKAVRLCFGVPGLGIFQVRDVCRLPSAVCSSHPSNTTSNLLLSPSPFTTRARRTQRVRPALY